MSTHSLACWISARAFSRLTGIFPQTLANWRYRDRLAGRDGPLSGYPLYRRFGGAIRYYLDPQLVHPAAASTSELMSREAIPEAAVAAEEQDPMRTLGKIEPCGSAGGRRHGRR